MKDLKGIGEMLKQRRKEMNLSLKEAENATSIRTTYLQSIEDGDMSKLISPIYAQGFLRQYASFLGLDGEGIIREHPELFNRMENHEFSYGIGTLEMRGNPSSGIKWLPNLVWAGALGLVLLAAWGFARLLGVI